MGSQQVHKDLIKSFKPCLREAYLGTQEWFHLSFFTLKEDKGASHMMRRKEATAVVVSEEMETLNK